MTGPICSQCGYPLRLVDIVEPPGRAADPSDTSGTGTWFFAGAHFDCTHCEQRAHVRPDGTGTMTIATIFGPPRSAKDHHAYVEHMRKEKAMFFGMSLAAHYITRSQYDIHIAALDEAVERYKRDHPLPRPLWKRILVHG